MSEVEGKKKFLYQGTLPESYVKNSKLLSKANDEGIKGTAAMKALHDMVGDEGIEEFLKLGKKYQQESRTGGRVANFSSEEIEKTATEHCKYYLQLSKIDKSAWRSKMRVLGDFKSVNFPKK
tara:strand:+ start:73 stop:438 length:366 start_codon:yes stop_codon:yes gene_type:complete